MAEEKTGKLNCVTIFATPEKFKPLQDSRDEKARINQLKNQKCKSKRKFKFTFCPCPICASWNKVEDKPAGKNYFKIPFTDIKLPRFDSIINLPKTFESNRRPGEVCGACGGTKKLSNTQNDANKYSEARKELDKQSTKLMQAEARMGTGGTRTTVIQNSEVLMVGMGFNDHKSYEIVPDSAVVPNGVGGGFIPQMNGALTNGVVGKQAGLGWPQNVGNYIIKCANKFNLLAGAGGISFSTTGPINFSGGMTTFSGPQVSLGCSQGPLVLEGDSVSIGGKHINISPTSGTLSVKGSISSTANMTMQGHAHFEGMSFVKALAVGTRKPTESSAGNPDVSITQPAAWSSSAITAAIMDIVQYYQNVAADPFTGAIRLLSSQELLNLAAKFATLTKASFPLELMPTAYIYPGTFLGIGNLGSPVVAGNFIPVFNVPHVHGIPESQHSHEMLVPEIDLTSQTEKALRQRVMTGAQDSGTPNTAVTSDGEVRTQKAIEIAASIPGAIGRATTELSSRAVRLFG